MPIPESELILNPDGSVYHLNLLPEDLADLVICVGDPDRVPAVSRYFDEIEVKKQKRELVTHTGRIGRQRITALSTGMSTDNIDIVFNELDALVNIDLKTRLHKTQTKNLKIIRVGTAGGLQANIPLDSFVISAQAVGLDNLANFYDRTHTQTEHTLAKKFAEAFPLHPFMAHCYVSSGDTPLIDLLGKDHFVGITVTCPGFYGPQCRVIRAKPSILNFPDTLTRLGMSNFEMETAGVYLMGSLLGHQACSISAIVANRCTQQFSTKAHVTIDKLIQFVLEKVAGSEKMA